MKHKVCEFLNNHYLLFLNLYLISIFLKSSSLVIDYPALYTFEKVLRIIAFLFMIGRCVVILPKLLDVVMKTKWQEKNRKEKILIITILALIVAVIINTIKIRSIRLLSIGLVVISAYNVDLKKILKNILIMQLAMTFIITACSIFGITRDYTISRLDDSVIRHSLGFSYPTNLSQIIFFISLIYMYLKKFKVDFLEILIFQIINIFTFYLTDSRTEILAFELLVIACILRRTTFVKRLVPICSTIITKIYILVPILSLIIVLLYPFCDIFKTMDKALSGRLSIQSKVISEGNIKLFGTDIKMVGYGLEDAINNDINTEYNYIDNDYIQILVVNGVIIALSLVILLYLLVLQLNKDKKYTEIFFIYTYLLFGLINPRVVELMYSPVLFFIIPTLFQKNNQDMKG